MRRWICTGCLSSQRSDESRKPKKVTLRPQTVEPSDAINSMLRGVLPVGTVRVGEGEVVDVLGEGAVVLVLGDGGAEVLVVEEEVVVEPVLGAGDVVIVPAGDVDSVPEEVDCWAASSEPAPAAPPKARTPTVIAPTTARLTRAAVLSFKGFLPPRPCGTLLLRPIASGRTTRTRGARRPRAVALSPSSHGCGLAVRRTPSLHRLPRSRDRGPSS